jgi:hypothetical protein
MTIELKPEQQRVAEGFSQAERGELMNGDAAVEMLRQRRAERLKTQE